LRPEIGTSKEKILEQWIYKQINKFLVNKANQEIFIERINIFYKKISPKSVSCDDYYTYLLSTECFYIIQHMIKYFPFPSDNCILHNKLKLNDTLLYLILNNQDNKIFFPESFLINCGTTSYTDETKFYLVNTVSDVHILAINNIGNILVKTAYTLYGTMLGTVTEYGEKNYTVRRHGCVEYIIY